MVPYFGMLYKRSTIDEAFDMFIRSELLLIWRVGEVREKGLGRCYLLYSRKIAEDHFSSAGEEYCRLIIRIAMP